MPDQQSVAPALTVAVAQPRTVARDAAANAYAHAEIIRRSESDVVIFPELSLTGYHLDAQPIDLESGPIGTVRGACGDARCSALVGAPVEYDGATYIGMLLVDADGAELVYRKAHPGPDERRFTAGPGAAAVTIGAWRIGLAICRDTGVVEHVEQTASLGIDLYACGVVHHDHERAEQDRRARHIVSTCRTPVAMASCAGPTGEGYERTAGHSSIWSADGVVLADAGPEPDRFARAVLRR